MSVLEDMKDYQTSSGSAYQVFQKLRSDNYFSWCASMESMLRSLSQWEVVTGQYPAPTRTTVDAPTAEELRIEKAWELRKERAYTEIDLRVEDQQRINIRGNRDPYQAWTTLRNVYGNRLANTRAALLAETTRVHYDGVSGILEHKNRMDTLCMKLTEARHTIPESLYLNFFINSLPEEYDSLVNTVDFELDSVEEVVSKLRQMEIKKSLRTVDTETAFASQKRTPRQRPPQNAQGAGDSTGRKGKGHPNTCYNCGERGHWARNCPRKNKSGGTHPETKGKTHLNENKEAGGKNPTVRGLFAALETLPFLGDEEVSQRFIVDSGASGHFVPERTNINDYVPFLAPKNITTATGIKVQAMGEGTMKVKVKNNDSTFVGKIPQVQWVPKLCARLLSQAVLIKDGFEIKLHMDGCTIYDPENRKLADIKEVGNTYPVELAIMRVNLAVSAEEALPSDDDTELLSEENLAERLRKMPLALAAKQSFDVMRWHQRLGHLNVAAVRELAQKRATGIELEENFPYDADCLACIHGKQSRLPFKTGRTRAISLGELIIWVLRVLWKQSA
jgi:gag-polypeptide of LTR copia-type/Pol polyprotein, beta-barrel domain/Zinc knuckle/GAG-pre-integrase domain